MTIVNNVLLLAEISRVAHFQRLDKCQRTGEVVAQA